MLGKKLFRRFDGDRDRGDSLVSAIIVFPLLFSFMTTIIDFSVLMVNRDIVNNALRDASRTVAIYGGAGSYNKQTTIERAYGDPILSDCGILGSTSYISIPHDRNGVSCRLMHQLRTSDLIAVDVREVKCTPSITTAIGQNVTCSAKWFYEGIPGSASSFVGALRTDGFYLTNNVSAQSEVKLNPSKDLVNR